MHTKCTEVHGTSRHQTALVGTKRHAPGSPQRGGRADPGSAGGRTLLVMVDRTDVVRSWPSAKDLAGREPPSDDDVPITIDGRRLDTPEKVIAFLEEINARRMATRHAG